MYLIWRLNQHISGIDTSAQQFWISAGSRKELVGDLHRLEMDALSRQLADPYATVPDHVVDAVTEALAEKIDDFFHDHRDDLVHDMEIATGQVVDELPSAMRLSQAAAEADDHLSTPDVQEFLHFLESADETLSGIKRITKTHSARSDSLPPMMKRRCLEFRNELDRQLRAYSQYRRQLPEIAEEWLYDVWQLIEDNPKCFGK